VARVKRDWETEAELIDYVPKPGLEPRRRCVYSVEAIQPPWPLPIPKQGPIVEKPFNGHLKIKELEELIRVAHLHTNLFFLVYNNKDVLAADHVPIAPLPIPVAVLVRVPVGAIPVSVGVHSSGAGGSSDGGRAGSGMIRAIGASHG
jgi:hypothetical protein